MKQISLIGTHNGIFHADDVLACAILRMINSESKLIRTRDEGELAKCDVIFDVGGRYSPEEGRFDHHQKERAGARPNGILFSSAGLVWKHFGAQICTDDIAEVIDRRLMQPIDATDNGQELFVGKAAFEGVMPYGYGFSSALSSLNPSWGDESLFDEAFEGAVELASQILDRELVYATGLIKARDLSRAAIKAAEDPRLVVLSRFHPWNEVVIAEAPKALFVVFPSETQEWMIQCVPDALGSFGKRKALPEAWKGLRGAELAKLTGVTDAIFCHPGLFIGGAKTREGALALAKLALAD